MSISRILLFLFLLTILGACRSDNTENKHPLKNIGQSKINPQEKSNEIVTNGTTTEEKVINIKELAINGKVKGVKNGLTQSFLNVEKDWGSPDKIDEVNGRYYAVYENKKITYGYDKNNIIYDVRSYDKNLTSLGFEDITKALGQPLDQRKNAKENIVVYQINDRYQLKFIILTATGKVDHISVYDRTWDTRSKQDYVLEIKGKSNKLSSRAWANMMKWRSNAVSIAKDNPSVFLNGPDVKKVALTFDDGPDTLNTPAIIDTLSKYQVKGSFFFNGEKAKQFPSVVKNAYEKGNLVLNHSFFHDDLTQKSSNDVRKDILDTEKVLEQIIGKKTAIIRPPYGETNQALLTNTKDLGYNIVLWSIDTLDWSQMEHDNIANNVLTNVRNGDIILMHSDGDKTETAKSVPIIIEGLKKKGFEIVDLADLLGIQPYKD